MSESTYHTYAIAQTNSQVPETKKYCESSDVCQSPVECPPTLGRCQRETRKICFLLHTTTATASARCDAIAMVVRARNRDTELRWAGINQPIQFHIMLYALDVVKSFIRVLRNRMEISRERTAQ